MTPKRQRLIFVGASMVAICAGVLLTLTALRDNVVFFYTPSELLQKSIASGQNIRIGGLVEEGSVKRLKEGLQFRLTDGHGAITIIYRGLTPTLFREGQGAVVEGPYQGTTMLIATRVLAKHDENYMPREVADKLKASGQWRGQP